MNTAANHADAEARTRAFEGKAMAEAIKLMREGGHPAEVAIGFLGAALEIMKGLSDMDTVRRMLHQLGDQLLDRNLN